MGDFEQVNFRVQENDDGDMVLIFDAREKPWGPTYMHLGLRLESDLNNSSAYNMLVNITHTGINSLGAEWKTDIVGGQTQSIFTPM